MLDYCALDVFTSDAFLGNPLAIVCVPKGTELNQAQKQLIAREFNFSETIFLHECDDAVFPIDIFTVSAELPFAGHPTVGAGYYLLSRAPNTTAITLKTKAGEISVRREGTGVRLNVPVDYKTHAPYACPMLKSLQKALVPHDFVTGPDDPIPVASIVKGMTFILLELTSVEALGKMMSYGQHFVLPDDHLGQWKGFTGVYIFVHMEDGTIRARMMEKSMEDPATGSAASTLCGWLAEAKGDGKWTFELVQGVEMGRKSEIRVFVEVVGGKVHSIELAGSAVQVMDGRLSVPKMSSAT